LAHRYDKLNNDLANLIEKWNRAVMIQALIRDVEPIRADFLACSLTQRHLLTEPDCVAADQAGYHVKYRKGLQASERLLKSAQERYPAPSAEQAVVEEHVTEYFYELSAAFPDRTKVQCDPWGLQTSKPLLDQYLSSLVAGKFRLASTIAGQSRLAYEKGLVRKKYCAGNIDGQDMEAQGILIGFAAAMMEPRAIMSYACDTALARLKGVSFESLARTCIQSVYEGDENVTDDFANWLHNFASTMRSPACQALVLTDFRNNIHNLNLLKYTGLVTRYRGNNECEFPAVPESFVRLHRRNLHFDYEIDNVLVAAGDGAP
jgi:hypothetical protein